MVTPERLTDSPNSFSIVPSPVVSAVSSGGYEKLDPDPAAAAVLPPAALAVRLPAVTSPAGGSKVAHMISHLERVNTNPQQMWMDALKEWQEVEPSSWAMPEGYKARLAPEYLTKVYSAPRPARVHAELFLNEHGCDQ